MITFMNCKAIRKWNAKTGELIWETEIKADPPPAIRDGYARMKLSDDGLVLYIPYGKKMMAISTEDGRKLWRKDAKFPDIINELHITKWGLLVKSRTNKRRVMENSFLIMINSHTGETIWREKFTHSQRRFVQMATGQQTNWMIQTTPMALDQRTFPVA